VGFGTGVFYPSFVMRTLFLDLGSNKGSLACVDDRSVVHLVAIDHRIDDSALMGLIERVVNDAGWTLRDLTHIACVTGPGGFTSLRVGVATANALGFTLGVPVAGVHLSDLWAARATEKSFWWLHSTKKKELFLRGFGDEAKSHAEPVCVSTDALASMVKGGVWTGELIAEQEAMVMELGIQKAEAKPLADVLPELLAGLSYNKKTLLPWYGRGY
jgi:tRNA threonylcarbamoyl adenosine modification protein YeaZ